MSVRTICPNCDKKLKVPDDAVGKKIKCPECAKVFSVEDSAADGSTAPPATIKGSPATPKKQQRPPDDKEDEAPRRPAKAAAKADESERPRKPTAKKSRQGDEQEEGRPTREGNKKKGSAATVLLILGGVGLFLCAGGGGLAYYLYSKASNAVGGMMTGAVANLPSQQGPPGGQSKQDPSSGGGDKPSPGGGSIDAAKLIRKWDIANAPGRQMEFQPGGVARFLMVTDGVEKEMVSGRYKLEGDTITLLDEKGNAQENFGKIKRLTDDECIIVEPKGESIVLRRPGYVGGELVANLQNQTDLHQFGIAYSNYVQGEKTTPATIEELAPYVENDARLVKAVRDGILILYWNVDVAKLTASSPNTVLGYEKDTPTKGGLVVLVNANTKLMTADEFKKATKPPSGGGNSSNKMPEFNELFSLESGFKNSEGKSRGATGIAISGDGKTALVMASIEKGNVQVWDLENRKKLYQYDNKSGSMLPVAISPDGKLGAYATQQSPSIAIIDLTSGKELRQLRKKGNIPLYFFTTGLAFSPAGDLLIVASDKEILGWNPTTGEQRLAWTESEEITALSNFFDKGKKIASATAKGIKVWDVGLGKDIQKFDPALKDDKVKKLFVTEDGKRLGLQGFYDPFKILDTSNGTVLKEFRGSPGLFSSVRPLPDGQTILYNGDWDYVVQDTNSGKSKKFGAIKDVRHFPVAITSDGTKFVTSDDTGRISVWSTKAPDKPVAPLKGQWGVEYGTDGKATFTTSASPMPLTIGDDSINWSILPYITKKKSGMGGWEMAEGKITIDSSKSPPTIEFKLGDKIYKGIYRLKTSEDGKSEKLLLLFSEAGGEFPKAFGADDFELPKGFPGFLYGAVRKKAAEPPSGGGNPAADAGATEPLKVNTTVQTIAFSPDGKLVAVVGSSSKVYLWDLVARKEVAALEGHDREAYTVAFSPNGKTLASGGVDGLVHLWDVDGRKSLGNLKGHKQFIFSVKFSPDGKTVGACGQDSVVLLWDLEKKEVKARLEHADFGLYSFAFSPDGSLIAAGGYGGSAKIWNTATGKEVATLKGHSDVTRFLAFSRDGKRLATASGDKSVIVWDVAKKEKLATLTGHTDGVKCVAFDKDGTSVVSASGDGTVKVWDVATSKETASFKGHRGTVWSVAVSPDGKTILSGGEDETLRFWEMPSQKKN